MKKKFDCSFLTRHWQLKLLSLCIGLSLWYIVVGEDQVDLVITVPLELQNLPADLIIANQYKKDIEVAISGPKRLIQEMRQQNISRPVNLGKEKPGALVIQNDAKSIPFPRGITVQRVQPETIILLVDRLVQKPFPIIPITKGKPAAGFYLEKLELKPSQITISGPQSILYSQPDLKTRVIDVSGLNQPTTLQVHLELNETLLQLIGESVIEANINIKEVTVRKKIGKIPVNLKDSPQGTKVRPAMVTVEADIPEQVIKTTPELSLLFRAAVTVPAGQRGGEVPVVVTAITPDKHNTPVIISVTPDKVRVLP